MKVFYDIVSNEELFSDVYPMELIADGTVYKVTGKLTTEQFQLDDAAIGGNKSAEEPGDDGADPSSTSGVNICLANKLDEYPLGKKAFKTSIQAYMKKVKAHLEKNQADQVDVFMKGVQPFIKKVLEEFDEYQFWFTENSKNSGYESMPALMRWDDEIAYMFFFKHGLREEKV